MLEAYVHPHALKHGPPEDEIVAVWPNFVRSQLRETPNEDECLRVGCGNETPTAIQTIGVVKPFGVLIVHVMTPPQGSILDELGIPRR